MTDGGIQMKSHQGENYKKLRALKPIEKTDKEMIEAIINFLNKRGVPSEENCKNLLEFIDDSHVSVIYDLLNAKNVFEDKEDNHLDAQSILNEIFAIKNEREEVKKPEIELRHQLEPILQKKSYLPRYEDLFTKNTVNYIAALLIHRKAENIVQASKNDIYSADDIAKELEKIIFPMLIKQKSNDNYLILSEQVQKWDTNKVGLNGRYLYNCIAVQQVLSNAVK